MSSAEDAAGEDASSTTTVTLRTIRKFKRPAAAPVSTELRPLSETQLRMRLDEIFAGDVYESDNSDDGESENDDQSDTDDESDGDEEGDDNYQGVAALEELLQQRIQEKMARHAEEKAAAERAAAEKAEKGAMEKVAAEEAAAVQKAAAEKAAQQAAAEKARAEAAVRESIADRGIGTFDREGGIRR